MSIEHFPLEAISFCRINFTKSSQEECTDPSCLSRPKRTVLLAIGECERKARRAKLSLAKQTETSDPDLCRPESEPEEAGESSSVGYKRRVWLKDTCVSQRRGRSLSLTKPIPARKMPAPMIQLKAARSKPYGGTFHRCHAEFCVKATPFKEGYLR